MRVEPLLAFTLLVPVSSCTYHTDAAVALDTRSPLLPIAVFDPLAGAGPALLDFDIVQRTCAMYVAMRSAAFEGPIAFGRDIDDSMVHWNKCPGGNLVACVETPTANGDTLITGIPWPH
ncbi:MAG: hypothetical protein ABI432_09610 [Flavobacteriales bacterium]